MRKVFCVLAVVVVASACAHHDNYPSRNFSWTGDITPGATVRVNNVDGSIAVVASTTNKLTVDAVIVNASPAAVQVKQAMSGNDVLFCTLFGSQSTETCGEGKHHSTSFSPFSFFSRRHPITVRYTVHVPAGVNVRLETVSGKIAAQDIEGNVKAETVNGDVVVSTTKGTINAETVNGSIIASMAQLPDSGDVHLETVNGSITSVLPEGIGGAIDLENANGAITANYPHTGSDSANNKHHLRIKLDEGARRVHLETVNGSVNLTKYVKTALVSLQN
jgi:Putative adhesin